MGRRAPLGRSNLFALLAKNGVRGGVMAGSGLGFAACQSKNFFADRMFLRNKYRQTGTKAAGNRELSYELLPFAYAQTTVCVYPNNRSRTPKQPFGYTQTLLLKNIVGHLRGTMGHLFYTEVPLLNI